MSLVLSASPNRRLPPLRFRIGQRCRLPRNLTSYVFIWRTRRIATSTVKGPLRTERASREDCWFSGRSHCSHRCWRNRQDEYRHERPPQLSRNVSVTIAGSSVATSSPPRSLISSTASLWSSVQASKIPRICPPSDHFYLQGSFSWSSITLNLSLIHEERTPRKSIPWWRN